MSDPVFPLGLRLALYPLYYIRNIGGFAGLTEDMMRTLPKDTTPIIEGLKWAAEHPDFDFTSVLPNLGYSNQDICGYVTVFLRQLTLHSEPDHENC